MGNFSTIKTLTGEIVKRVKDFREAQQQVELPEMELDWCTGGFDREDDSE